MDSIEKVFSSHPNSTEFADGYLIYLTKILASLDRRSIGLFTDTLNYAREHDATIFFIGNGGSASTASHFANDIAIGTRSWTKPFRALSLCDNNAVVTAIANDYGFENVFTLQLKNLMKPGDVVVAISVSGNSPNIIQAIEYANAHDGITMGITGFDGGALKAMTKVNVHAPTFKGEYGPAEDVHLIINHLVATFLIKQVAMETPMALPVAKSI